MISTSFVQNAAINARSVNKNISLDSFVLSKPSYEFLTKGRTDPESKEEFRSNNVLFLEDKAVWAGAIVSKSGTQDTGIKSLEGASASPMRGAPQGQQGWRRGESCRKNFDRAADTGRQPAFRRRQSSTMQPTGFAGNSLIFARHQGPNGASGSFRAYQVLVVRAWRVVLQYLPICQVALEPTSPCTV